MTSPIYDLLPAHIRTRDLEADGAFKALFDLMQREGDPVSYTHLTLPTMQ